MSGESGLKVLGLGVCFLLSSCERPGLGSGDALLEDEACR